MLSPKLSLVVFWLLFFTLLFFLYWLNKKYHILRDTPANSPEQNGSTVLTYSLSSVFMAWWTLLILPAYVLIAMRFQELPDLSENILILLGLSTATTAISKAIDNPNPVGKPISLPVEKSANFLGDILSKGDGAGIHRFQFVLFNLVIGIWFISATLSHLGDPNAKIGNIFPEITAKSLILLGIGSAVYTGIKTTEMKP